MIANIFPSQNEWEYGTASQKFVDPFSLKSIFIEIH